MSERNKSSPERRLTWPQARPPIHKSRDNQDNSGTQKRLAKSRDDFTLSSPESSFTSEKMHVSESRKTSKIVTEDNEEHSDFSDNTDDETSIADSLDDKFIQHSTPIYENESAPIPNARRRFQAVNSKRPLYESVSINSINSDKDRSNQSGTNQTSGHTTSNFLVLCLSAFLALCVVGVLCTVFGSQNVSSTEACDIRSIKKNFTTQDDYLWIAFESGVQDVVRMSKPSTFILLYKKEAEFTLTNLLHQLSKYAACNITDCSKQPIEISSAELNSPEVIKNYGIIIENYRDELEDKGVVIVKNLESVPGVSAQAFHSICDEFTPLVEKSLIIFTMKVDKLPQSEDRMKFVEEYFRKKWTDIKSDTFNALITRITSMVIEIRA